MPRVLRSASRQQQSAAGGATARGGPLPGSLASASAAAAMAVLFLASALLQLNDPDPHLWVPMYAAPCALIVWELASGSPPLAAAWAAVAAAAVGLGAAAWPPAAAALAKHGLSPVLLETEEWREISGLALLVTWCAVACARARARESGGRWLAAAALAVPVTASLGAWWWFAHPPAHACGPSRATT